MIIRKMLKSDYDRLYDMWIHTPGMGLNDIDDSREGIEKFIDRNPNTSFVVMEDNKMVGSIMAGHDGRRAQVHHTVVLPEYRGRGIGRALVAEMEKAMKAEGIFKIFLVVFKRNEIGNGFWDKIGYDLREDINYRNKALAEFKRNDT